MTWPEQPLEEGAESQRPPTDPAAPESPKPALERDPSPWPPSSAAGASPWPAPQSPAAAVWPPPPTSFQAVGAALYTLPFKTQFVRIEGGASDFRTGLLEVTAEGFRISGKAVQNAETQIPILILTLFLRLWLIAALLMEYALRKDKWLIVPWQSVRQVGLDARRSRVCLVFDAPNDKGVPKVFSLAFRVDPVYYDSFVEVMRQFLGPRVAEAKMRAWNSPAMVMFLIGLTIGIGFLIVLGIISLVGNGK